MKKKSLLFSLAAATMMMASCGTQGGALTQAGAQILTGVLTGQGVGSSVTQGVTNAAGTLGNVLASVLGGSAKPTKKQIIGSWSYSSPGCAFTSEQLLAKAGGEVVAAQIKQKLQPTYQTLGVNSNNTKVTFTENNTFSASFAGVNINGSYTFDEASSKVTMKGTLITLNCYAKRNIDGIALLFESSKLLTLLQTISAMSGNATLQTVGELSKSYDGLRLGFDFK